VFSLSREEAKKAPLSDTDISVPGNPRSAGKLLASGAVRHISALSPARLSWMALPLSMVLVAVPVIETALANLAVDILA
jgi:hypothetical protein